MPNPLPEKRLTQRQFLIPAVYCLVGGLYIIVSDWIVGRYADDLNYLWIETAKGLGFVATTALVLWYLLRREENSRERSEAFFRTLVDSMQDAVFVLDVPERVLTYANPAATRIFGYENEEFLGRATEFLHVSTEHYKDFHNRGMQSLSEGIPFHTNFKMRRKDGSTFDSSHIVSLINFSDGSQMALSMVKDFTPLEISERKFREQEQMLRQVAENLREIFWISDTRKERMDYVSPAYRDVWGREPEELLNKPMSFLDAVHEEDYEWVRQEVERQHEGNYDVQYRIVRPDGEIRWIWDRARPIQNESGEIYRMVGVAEDITDIKLKEDELMHARKLEYLGEFSSGITHDFRNYLAVILGNAEILEEDIQDSGNRKTLSLIKQAAMDARESTNRLLAFARKQALREETVNLNELIDKLIPILNPMLGKQIKIETELGEGLWNTTIDRHNFESCLINIVRNACDAMPEGGSISISTGNESSSSADLSATQPIELSKMVCVRISDTGHGMDTQTSLHVFDPYFTTKESGEGTGLGLSMAHGFVHQSGGRIEVESTPGKGTTFSLYFPRQE